MGYTFQQENQAWAESNSDPKETVDEAKSSDEGKDEGSESGYVADPTGQTGTIDTSGTSGTTETAADVSPVFDVADEANAENPAPEGTPFAADIDPAATGDDALVPDYSDVKTDDQGRYVPDAADETLVNTQTTDTTGTAGTDGSAAAHEGSEKVGAEAAAEANGDAAGDEADDSTGGFNLRKNPADFTVKEIVAWMATASDEQKEKVKAKEKDGDARKGILDF
jgi:hypothetical protein